MYSRAMKSMGQTARIQHRSQKNTADIQVYNYGHLRKMLQLPMQIIAHLCPQGYSHQHKILQSNRILKNKAL